MKWLRNESWLGNVSSHFSSFCDNLYWLLQRAQALSVGIKLCLLWFLTVWLCRFWAVWLSIKCDPVVPDPQRAALHSFPRWHTADLGHPGDLQEKQTALEEGEVCAGQELPEGESVSSLQQQSWLHGTAGEWGTRGCWTHVTAQRRRYVSDQSWTFCFLHRCVHVKQNLEREGKRLCLQLWVRSQDSRWLPDGLRSDPVAVMTQLSSSGLGRGASVVQMRYHCVCAIRNFPYNCWCQFPGLQRGFTSGCPVSNEMFSHSYCPLPWPLLSPVGPWKVSCSERWPWIASSQPTLGSVGGWWGQCRRVCHCSRSLKQTGHLSGKLGVVGQKLIGFFKQNISHRTNWTSALLCQGQLFADLVLSFLLPKLCLARLPAALGKQTQELS